MKVYEKVYNYYVEQIESGKLAAEMKMPSLRECVRALGVSRTSAETAYMMLAADGYIYSVEKVGYFVTDIAVRKSLDKDDKNKEEKKIDYQYDLATIGEDKQVSCLDLWRRYMKSALRQEDRLLTTSDNQGEEDLRQEIAAYVRKNRNIICSSEDIVIGAGFQTLLSILIALIPGEKTISFPTKDFVDAQAIFAASGFEINYRDKSSHIIYVTPSYMTKWGQVMTMKRRQELIEHAKNHGHLLIEDDYQNEFVFSTSPTPSIYAMTGGENVAFLGSFSRVLLPSVRISYLILPRNVRENYLKIKPLYNQTSSKAEQIALTQFLRDGHMNRHIRKMRRCYEEKRNLMFTELEKQFCKNAGFNSNRRVKLSVSNSDQVMTISDDTKPSVFLGESGMEIGLYVPGKNLEKKIDRCRVKINLMEVGENGAFLLLSCSQVPIEKIADSIQLLNEGLQE